MALERQVSCCIGQCPWALIDNGVKNCTYKQGHEGPHSYISTVVNLDKCMALVPLADRRTNKNNWCILDFHHTGPHKGETGVEWVTCTPDHVTPTHYQGDYVMRIIEDFNLDFLRGTVVKYLLRAGNKPDQPELVDLLKAKWYLERKIKQLEKEK
jgi:Protein of unknwon function (DUF3310)